MASDINGPTYKGRRPPNPLFERVVETLLEEFDFTETQIRAAHSHFFNWQRSSFSNAEYACYYWPGFGTFTYFNKENRGPYYEAADEYLNSTKVIDRYKRLKIPEKISKVKHKAIDEIMLYHPKCVHQHEDYKDCGWWVASNTNKGGWNKKTLLTKSEKFLYELLSYLKQGCTKLNKSD